MVGWTYCVRLVCCEGVVGSQLAVRELETLGGKEAL